MMISSGARLLYGKKIPSHLVPGSITDALAISASRSGSGWFALGVAMTAGGRAEMIGDHELTRTKTCCV